MAGITRLANIVIRPKEIPAGIFEKVKKHLASVGAAPASAEAGEIPRSAGQMGVFQPFQTSC
jgi:hypothetical protein